MTKTQDEDDDKFEAEAWTGPSDADKRTTKWSDDSANAVPVHENALPVYGHGGEKHQKAEEFDGAFSTCRGAGGGGGKHKKKGAARDEPSDPRVALAKRILALEQSKKLSNKDRQELRKLRKEAENRGIDVEGMAKGKSRGNNNNAPAVVRDEDEEEINRLMERIKDLGTIKI